MADIDQSTGTPRKVTLSDVFSKIELAPAQAGEFLRTLALSHLGGPHDEMARTLMQHANDIADPATYGEKAPDNPQLRWQASPVAAPTTSADTSWQAAARAAGWTSNTPEPEPEWLAAARAAGWTAPTDNTEKQPSGGVPDNPLSYRYWDDSRKLWINRMTGQPVEGPSPSTSPQPTPPPTS